jgi:D-3-phosphoglycerate dehydrogenase
MVGHIGTLLGRHGINIASMNLHRDEAGGRALTVLHLDNAPDRSVLEELERDPDIDNVRLVYL